MSMDEQILTREQLRSYTNDFSEKNLLGRGTYGAVYKGMREDGLEIAVKVLLDGSQNVARQQFENEFDILQKLQHQNIVSFVGYTYQTEHQHIELTEDDPDFIEQKGKMIFAGKNFRALSIEYMSKGSLQSYLSVEGKGHDWYTRYQILRGACEAINYLHNVTDTPVLHLDIKPDNILLNKYMEPKLADFGLSKWFPEEQIVDKNPIGTEGYIPPEHIDDWIVSKQFDIFSLGVVLLEIIAGPDKRFECAQMPPHEFVNRVLGNWKKRLQLICRGPNLEAYCEQVRKCTEIALNCMDDDRLKRPNIGAIIDELDAIEKISPGWNETEMISVSPRVLSFPIDKENWMESQLSIINMTDSYVGFYILREFYEVKYYSTDLWLDTVEPNSTKLVTVKMMWPPLLSMDTVEALVITVENKYFLDHILDMVISDPSDEDKLLKRIRAMGCKVQGCMLTSVFSEPAAKTTMTTTKIVPPKQFGTMKSIDVHSTEPWILIGHDKGYVSIWNYHTQEKGIAFHLKDLKGGINTIQFVAQKEWVAIGGDGYIHVYTLPEMQLVRRLEIDNNGPNVSCLTSLDVHSTNPSVLSSRINSDTIQLSKWDGGPIKTSDFIGTEEEEEDGVDKGYWKVKFNPMDPDTFVSASPVKVWSINSPKPVAEFNSALFDYPFTGSDRQCIIIEIKKGVEMWDLRTNKCHHTFNIGKTPDIIVCHPTIPLLATMDSDDQIIYLWNTATYKLEGKVPCSAGEVSSIKFAALRRLAIQFLDRIEIMELAMENI